MRRSFPAEQWATLVEYTRLHGKERDGGKGATAFKKGLQDNFFEMHPDLLLPQAVEQDQEGGVTQSSERLETSSEVAQRVAKTKQVCQHLVVSQSHVVYLVI